MSNTTEKAIEAIKKNALRPDGDEETWNSEVQDDMDGERETMPPVSEPAKLPGKRSIDEVQDDQEFKTAVLQASKGVNEKTHDEYLR